MRRHTYLTLNGATCVYEEEDVTHHIDARPKHKKIGVSQVKRRFRALGPMLNRILGKQTPEGKCPESALTTSSEEALRRVPRSCQRQK